MFTSFKRPMWLVKSWHVIWIKTSSVNEVHNHSTTHNSTNCFWTTWKLITAHNSNCWKCGILKQIIYVYNVPLSKDKTTWNHFPCFWLVVSNKVSLIQSYQWLLWPWSYGSWIYNYLCNQCPSPLMLWVRISIRASCTLCDKVCQGLATGRWFSPSPTVFSTNKTDRYDITGILLKVALNTITLN